MNRLQSPSEPEMLCPKALIQSPSRHRAGHVQRSSSCHNYHQLWSPQWNLEVANCFVAKATSQDRSREETLCSSGVNTDSSVNLAQHLSMPQVTEKHFHARNMDTWYIGLPSQIAGYLGHIPAILKPSYVTRGRPYINGKQEKAILLQTTPHCHMLCNSEQHNLLPTIEQLYPLPTKTDLMHHKCWFPIRG